MNPLISVIIPVYNTSLAVRRLLAVLLNQTYERLEIICVDDGSTDDSLKQIRKLSKTDERLKVFHQANAGASSARNLGLKHATGDFIAFIDSDDLVTLDYFELMLNVMRYHRSSRKSRHPQPQYRDHSSRIAFSVCGFHYFRLNSRSQSDVFINELPPQRSNEPSRAYLLRLMHEDGRLYSSVNKLFHGDLIRQQQLQFDVQKNFAEDTKFVFDYLDAWLNQHQTRKIKIVSVLKPLYIYNFGTETSTVKKSSLIWKNWESSLADFAVFAKPLPPAQAKKLLGQLRRRFKISHALAVARAPISRSKKLNYLSPLQLRLAEIAIKFRP